jgi:hypothetical protein
MNFKKINENYYEFKIDNEVLSVKISKFLFHNISFELQRITDTGKSVNLIKALSIIKEIIINYVKNRKEVSEVILIFHENKKINKLKWINICESYIRRNSIEVHRMGDYILAFRIK